MQSGHSHSTDGHPCPGQGSRNLSEGEALPVAGVPLGRGGANHTWVSPILQLRELKTTGLLELGLLEGLEHQGRFSVRGLLQIRILFSKLRTSFSPNFPQDNGSLL